MVGLNVEQDAKAATDFANENIPYAVLLDMSETARAYHVRGIPATYLIDENGVVLERWVGYGPGLETTMRDRIIGLIR